MSSNQEPRRWTLFGSVGGHGCERVSEGPMISPGRTVEVVEASAYAAAVERAEREHASANEMFDEVFKQKAEALRLREALEGARTVLAGYGLLGAAGDISAALASVSGDDGEGFEGRVERAVERRAGVLEQLQDFPDPAATGSSGNAGDGPVEPALPAPAEAPASPAPPSPPSASTRERGEPEHGHVIVDLADGSVRAADDVWHEGLLSWLEAVGGQCVAGEVRVPIERVDWSNNDEPLVHVAARASASVEGDGQAVAADQRPFPFDEERLNQIRDYFLGPPPEWHSQAAIELLGLVDAMREAITRTLSAWHETAYVGGIDEREAWRVMGEALSPFQIHEAAKNDASAARPEGEKA